MSDESIRQLTLAIRDLTIATRTLTREIANRPSTAAQASTEAAAPARIPILLGELSRLPFPDHFLWEETRLAHRGAEDGPPSVPSFVFDFARTKISNKPPGIQSRVEAAYNSGFWAKISLDTSTPYLSRQLDSGSVRRHWVVLRSSFGEAFRANSLKDFKAICNSEDPDLICETFESVAEIDIFCLGAGVTVPCLRGCSSNS